MNLLMISLSDISKFNKLFSDCHKKILEIYNQDFDVYVKQDKSPLTEADLETNKLILEFLHKEYPDIYCLSEETKAEEYEKRKDYKYLFIIDPIDGTKEFVKKNGEFTVNIGLIEKQNNGKYEPIFGAVGIPVENTVYYGFNYEHLKYVHVHNLDSNNINVITNWSKHNKDTNKSFDSIFERLNKLKTNKIKFIASKSHFTQETADIVSLLNKDSEMENYGSSLKFLKMIEGEANLYPRLVPTSEWDTCASHAIMKAYGMNIFKYNKESPFGKLEQLDYNKENILNPYFISF